MFGRRDRDRSQIGGHLIEVNDDGDDHGNRVVVGDDGGGDDDDDMFVILVKFDDIVYSVSVCLSLFLPCSVRIALIRRPPRPTAATARAAALSTANSGASQSV